MSQSGLPDWPLQAMALRKQRADYRDAMTVRIDGTDLLELGMARIETVLSDLIVACGLPSPSAAKWTRNARERTLTVVVNPEGEEPLSVRRQFNEDDLMACASSGGYSRAGMDARLADAVREFLKVVELREEERARARAWIAYLNVVS